MPNTTAVTDSAIHQWKFKYSDTWNDCTSQEFKIRVEDGYITRTLYATQPAPSGDAVEVLREALCIIDNVLFEIGIEVQREAPDLPHVENMAVNAIHAVSDARAALATTSRAATVAKDGGEVTGERIMQLIDEAAKLSAISAVGAIPLTPIQVAFIVGKVLAEQRAIAAWNRRTALPPPIVEPVAGGLCPIDLTHPLGERRRVVIASDEMIDGERVLCIAIQDPASAPSDGAADARDAAYVACLMACEEVRESGCESRQGAIECYEAIVQLASNHLNTGGENA